MIIPKKCPVCRSTRIRRGMYGILICHKCGYTHREINQ